MIRRIFLCRATGTDPHENLALEQYLLEHVEPESCILYLWQNRHTVVLGRNQNAWQECRCAQLEADGGFLARRLSGGGAVFHDLGNLNFTFLVPTQDYDLERQLSVVAQACLGLGLSVERSGRNDVLCQGRKFSGNAFYSHQGKSYHHGTLLVDVDLEAMARYLSPSPAKLQAKGVASVRSRVVNLKQLCPQLTVEEMGRQMELAFGQVYGLPVEIMDPRQLDAQAIQALTEHNRSWSWLYGRKLPFTLQCAQKFDWGELTVQLKADEGVIQEAAVYSDAMDWTLAPQLEAALTGCPLERQALEHRLVEFPKELREGIEGLFRQQKVGLIRGTGTILAPDQVEVEGKIYSADKILIATGSVPARPPIPGLEHALTSDELLEHQDQVCKSLVIIGGGVIGMEFASLYQMLGCRVTVLETMDRILPNMDREVCQNLSMILKKRGVQIFAGARVEQVEKAEEGYTVRFTQKGQSAQVQGEVVLCAIGRRPNTQGLFGPDFSVEQERGRILVDENFQTSVPGVYAVGDVSARIQLAHVASAQGTACVERLAGSNPLTNLNAVPSCIYTDPEIACVGLTADEAKAAGRAVKVGKYVMFSNGRTVIVQGQRGFIKVVADQETGVILGAQLMCQRATDMISQFTAAVVNGLTAQQLLAAMRPHPTFDEGAGEALEDLLAKLEAR